MSFYWPGIGNNDDEIGGAEMKMVAAEEQERIMREQNTYPQDEEKNEYRYISPDWLDAVATGLTAGAVKHPGETWRQIPAKEHAARALRHLNLYLMGDKADKHLVNASMRCMMAFETAQAEDQREEWEKLMKDMERGRL